MKQLISWLKAIGKLINFTRLLILNVVFFLIVFIAYSAMHKADQKINVAKNSTLYLDFNGQIVEQKKPIDFSSELSKQLLSNNDQEIEEYQVDNLIYLIHRAQNDPKINDILMELDGLQGASLNHLQDVGQALNDFKSSGKTITAISDNYSQSQYLLASYADKIYLNPQGLVLLQGFSVYRLYFKEVLDNLLITPHIFKVGTYKSYVEPYTQSHMSDASKLANTHWLNQLWDNYIKTVVAQRKDKGITKQSISPSLAQLKTALIKADGDSALYAKQAGLVDFLNNRYQIIKKLKEAARSAGTKLNLINYRDYQSTLPAKYRLKNGNDQIALIHGSGEILAGDQDVGAIGGESFSYLLNQALINKNIKAVVLRIDSPGGSAFASEKIRQQVLALKQAKKTVVVSMGSVAASGGYWIASAADYIVASPTTLTGSIGIFGMFASANKALNKLGIYNDGVSTNALSSISPTRPLDPALAEIMQIGIEHGYKQFLTVVAKGRNMSTADVDKIAQGRVWTGVDALNNGLVDQLGTLQDAIVKAASLANLTDYSIKEVYLNLSEKQRLLKQVFGYSIKAFGHSISLDPNLLKAADQLKKQATILTRFNDPQGRYAYCPMCLVE